MTEVIRPTLSYEMLQIGTKGGILAVRAFKEIFGPQNYNEFRRAGKKGEYIPELDRQRVDRQGYDRFGEMFGVARDERAAFWYNAMKTSNATIEYARRVLFAEQERQATLITGIANGSKRPSAILERLTTPAIAEIPSEAISRKYRYEQARQLAIGLLCAEVLSSNENGQSEEVFSMLDQLLEDKLFIGRKGATKNYHIFSYHQPKTNRLVGLSQEYPDARFEGCWVKSLDRPVRTIGIRNSAGEVVMLTPALYDYREKEIESIVIKAMRKSFKPDQPHPNGNLIETSHGRVDALGLRLVIMEGERPLRDRITAQLEDDLRTLDGVCEIREDDKVDPENGSPDRVQFRRRQVYKAGSVNLVEVIIQAHKDYLAYQYEVGEFNPELGMHGGPAWEFYRLDRVSEVAPYIWPFPYYGIDHVAAKRRSSYEYATRLWRKERIVPAPYQTES